MNRKMIARELVLAAREISAKHALDDPYKWGSKIEGHLDKLLKDLKRARGTSDFIDEKLLAEIIKEVDKASTLIQDANAGMSDISTNIESRRWNFNKNNYGEGWRKESSHKAREISAKPLDARGIKNDTMRATGKAVSALYKLDIDLADSYHGDKGKFDAALHELRFNHIRQAMELLNSGDLLNLIKKMEKNES